MKIKINEREIYEIEIPEVIESQNFLEILERLNSISKVIARQMPTFIPMIAQTTSPISLVNSPKNKLDGKKYKIVPYTNEQKQFIVDNWGKMKPKEIAERIGHSDGSIQQFYYKWKKAGKPAIPFSQSSIPVPIQTFGRLKRQFSEQEIEYIRRNLATESITTIARNLNMPYTSVYEKIQKLKKQGVL